MRNVWTGILIATVLAGGAWAASPDEAAIRAQRDRSNRAIAAHDLDAVASVWLDHISFGVRDYKKSASFYEKLLGWTPTYDEGSQIELMIADVGDIIIRGGNPRDPAFGKGETRRTGVDHVSFGISPWDTDGVKAELEKRGLRAVIDTSSKHKGPNGAWEADEIHAAAFKSYHTETPNGYNLQISYVTRENRLALANAVNPKKVSGQ